MKAAPAETAIHELIRDRWSPRAFSSRPVDPSDLRSLFEAARWAPSSMNEQPWSFVVADRSVDPDAHSRAVSTLMHANAVWAQRAPVLLIAVAHNSYTRTGAPNRHALYDTGQAVALLTVEATARGLSVHQMGGFGVGEARKQFGIPETHEPVAVLAIGYAAPADELPEDLRARDLAPRQRRPAPEWVHNGQWSEQAVPAARFG